MTLDVLSILSYFVVTAFDEFEGFLFFAECLFLARLYHPRIDGSWGRHCGGVIKPSFIVFVSGDKTEFYRSLAVIKPSCVTP